MSESETVKKGWLWATGWVTTAVLSLGAAIALVFTVLVIGLMLSLNL